MTLYRDPLKIRLPYARTLSNSEWNRIIDGVDYDKRLAAKQKELGDGHKARYKHSKDMSKTWDNTPAGKRRVRLEEAERQAAKEEEERINTDIAEAEYQAELKREYISRANKLLFFGQERVRRLNFAYRLGEVLKERDAQLEFKRKHASLFNKRDIDYIEHVKRDVEKFKEEEEFKKQLKKMKNHLYGQQLKEQMEQKESELLGERLEQFKETKDIQEDVKRYDPQVFEERRKAVQRLYKKDLEILMENKRIITELETKRDLVSEKKAAKFNESMAVRRKILTDKLKERHLERWRKQKKAVDYLANLEVWEKQKEEFLFAKAVKERDEAADLKYIEDEKKKQEKLEIARATFHKQQLQLKQRKDEECRINMEQKRLIEEDIERWKEVEEKKKREKFKREKELQEFLRFQIEWRKKHPPEGIDVDKKGHELLMNKMAHEDRLFHLYAQDLIEENERKGKNTYAIKKAAASGVGGGTGPVYTERGNLCPKYLSAMEDGDDLFHLSRRERRDTYKNLGFFSLHAEHHDKTNITQ